jgi:hypothetical protein
MVSKSIVSLFFFFFFASTWPTPSAAALRLFAIPPVFASARKANVVAASMKNHAMTTTRKRRRPRPIIQKMFDSADINHDGTVSREEAYILVLKWYIKINQRAPIPPPTRQTVYQVFDLMRDDSSNSRRKNHDLISIDEFASFTTELWRRALVRVVAHKLVTVVGAPLLAAWIVKKISQHATIVSTLHTLCKKLVPDRFLPTVATKAFGRTFLTILFCISLGNFVMSRVNEVQAFYLHYQEQRKKAKPLEI